MFQLIKHSIKSTLRSGFFRGGLAIRLFMGLISLYFLVIAGVLSIVLPELARKVIDGNETLVDITSKYLLYYLLVDLFLRFLAQSLKGVNLQHYILLPVSYRRLIHLMLGRSLFNFYTLLALIVFVPFAIRGVAADMGGYTAVFWLVGMLALITGNSLLAVYLKLLFSGGIKASLVMVGLMVLAFASESLGFPEFSLSQYLPAVLSPVLSGPWALVLFVYPVLGYRANFLFLVSNRYAESARVADSSKDTFWSKLEWQGEGRISALMAMEWKLILRHKRTRTLLMFTPIFLAYGLLFYRAESSLSSMLVFAGIFITGFAAMNYGQYLGAWEARFFDGIFSRGFAIEDYYHAKFRLLALLIGVSYLLSLVYAFMDVKYFYLHTACFLFNLGFNTFILMFFSTYQRKPLDLNAGSAFNYQGMSAVQFLVTLPLLIVPILLYFMTTLFYSELIGFAVVGGAGLFSLAFYKVWIKGISDNFREKKHAMATGFRKKD